MGSRSFPVYGKGRGFGHGFDFSPPCFPLNSLHFPQLLAAAELQVAEVLNAPLFRLERESTGSRGGFAHAAKKKMQIPLRLGRFGMTAAREGPETPRPTRNDGVRLGGGPVWPWVFSDYRAVWSGILICNAARKFRPSARERKVEQNQKENSEAGPKSPPSKPARMSHPEKQTRRKKLTHPPILMRRKGWATRADVCAEHLRCQARRLPESNSAHLAYSRKCQFYRLAGCALSAALPGELAALSVFPNEQTFLAQTRKLDLHENSL